MELQRLYSYVRKTLQEFNMIEEGDKVAVGISGGKDSLTLLYALAGLRKFYPKKFELVAITVDLGYEANVTTEYTFADIQNLCEDLEVPYYIVETEIFKMVEEGGCSLCSRLRKGALNEKALELGCNKIAYAHNMDDVVETMMLSLIYEGRFTSFWPVTKFDDCNLSIIRPLMHVSAREVVGFRNKYNLPVVKSPCPYDGYTEREYVRNLLKDIENHAPGTRKRMMTALKNVNFNMLK